MFDYKKFTQDLDAMCLLLEETTEWARNARYNAYLKRIKLWSKIPQNIQEVKRNKLIVLIQTMYESRLKDIDEFENWVDAAFNLAHKSMDTESAIAVSSEIRNDCNQSHDKIFEMRIMQKSLANEQIKQSKRKYTRRNKNA